MNTLGQTLKVEVPYLIIHKAALRVVDLLKLHTPAMLALWCVLNLVDRITEVAQGLCKVKKVTRSP